MHFSSPAPLLGQLAVSAGGRVPHARDQALGDGFAAVPMISGLMEAGMTPGAALAFMTAGAMTSIPAAIVVFAFVKRTVFGWYPLLPLLGSGLSGILYQLITR